MTQPCVLPIRVSIHAGRSSQPDFVYFRFHGRTRLFTSNYTGTELAEEAKKIRRTVQEGRDVYVYFNNDAAGYAIANARKLTDMM
jgi:uncharacterized protein YecE (DUF72 family)